MTATCQARDLREAMALISLSKSVLDALPEMAAAGEDFDVEVVEVLAFDFEPGGSLVEGTPHL